MDNGGGDDDVVAYIYPAVGTEGYSGAKLTIGMNKGHPGYRPPRHRHPEVLEHAPETVRSGPPDIFNRRDRARTQDVEERDPLEYEACIRVTFEHIPKTRFGLRCGRSEDAELRLAPLPAVGFYHLALAFNQDYCLVVQDLGSTCGTTVVYGRTERGRWSSFPWIIGGSDFLKGVSPIMVKVSQFLQFRLVVPQHDVHSQSYRDRVDRFRAGTADTEPLLDLGHVGLLSRRRTEPPSGVQTPASRPTAPVTVRKKLGKGSFAVVYRVWNVSTGEQYALKKPDSRSFDAAAWEREALIMDRIDHKHIVSLLNSCSGPTPWLHLEYVPGGSIGDHLEARRFSRHECKQILAQTLEALAYLHTLDPPVVHRDVKPNNILVAYRRPDAIFVKFADFGLSREGDALKSICGTCLYLAPEVYEADAVPRARRAAYTALVDVWSLGVVLAELACGLPPHGTQESMGVEWCESVRLRVERMIGPQGDDLLSFLLDSMLGLRPAARKTATDCLTDALRLLNHGTDEGSNGAVSDSYSPDNSENEASTIRLGEPRGADDSETTEPERGDPRLRSSALDRYIVSNAGRHVRSTNAPSPKATTEHVEQLLSKLDNPEDSLFYRSSFGYGSDGDSGESGGSGSASTVTTPRDTRPQGGEVQGSPETRLEAAPPSDAGKDMGEVAEVAEETDTRRSNEADVAPSSKRPRITRSPLMSGGSSENRTAKRNKTVAGEGQID